MVGILKGQGEPGQGEGQVASLVPPELRGQVIEFSHTAAHLGEAKTLAGITRYFSWGKMRADVHRYIEHCPVCVEKQVPNLKEGVHVPRVSHQQNEVLYMDLIGPFPPTVSEYRYILTCMDGFSRYIMVAPLKGKSAKEVTAAMVNTWIKGGGGIPRSVYMDQGKEFTATLSQMCYKQLGIEIHFAVADNHQSNPIERFHRTLWNLIKAVRKGGENNLMDAVRTAVMTYNGSKHASTGQTPNALFLGCLLYTSPSPRDA